MTSLRVGAATDIGRVRTSNQDSYLLRDRLFAVADGMGGHLGGEVASELAVDTLGQLTLDPTPDNLLSGVQQANHVIWERARKDPELRGMGTTLCAVAVVTDDDDEELAIVNVGDSRVYLFRDNDLVQVTRDHSLVEDMRAEGRITDEEAAVHPQRNIVTRALGIAARVEVDEFSVIPHTGDRLVLCSDGLFNEVSVDRIAATLRRLADPQEASHELVRLANEGGGRDNITCVVVDVVDDAGRAERAAGAGAEMVRSRPKRAPDMAGFTTATADDTNGSGLRTWQGDARATAAAVADAPTEPAASPGTTAPPSRRAAKRAARRARAAEPKAKAFTWRTALFLLLFTAVVGAVIGALAWYGRGAYYVGYDAGDTVTIYQGRPGGFLWFDPTFVENSGVARSQVPAMFADALDSGRIWSSRHDAEVYVENIRTQICEQASQTHSSATTTTLAGTVAGPSTTLPAKCANPATSTTTTVPAPPTTRKRGTATTNARPTVTAKR